MRTDLSAHNFNEMEHFVGAFFFLLVFIIVRFVCWVKIFTPKFINFKTALVYIKMNVALFEIGSTGFPNFCFRMQCLYSKLCTITDTFGVFFGRNKENFQFVIVGFFINL